MAINTIATHPRDHSVGIFCNSVALVWPLWLEGRCQASNVKVVAGDLFATPNPLTSHPEKNLLPRIPKHDGRSTIRSRRSYARVLIRIWNDSDAVYPVLTSTLACGLLISNDPCPPSPYITPCAHAPKKAFGFCGEPASLPACRCKLLVDNGPRQR
jgi:hypothetical protein